MNWTRILSYLDYLLIPLIVLVFIPVALLYWAGLILDKARER